MRGGDEAGDDAHRLRPYPGKSAARAFCSGLRDPRDSPGAEAERGRELVERLAGSISLIHRDGGAGSRTPLVPVEDDGSPRLETQCGLLEAVEVVAPWLEAQPIPRGQ